MAANPSLLTNLTERQSAALLLAAPGIRISDGMVLVPGGSAAAPVWQALVGRPVSWPLDFVHALISAEAAIAYFYGAAAQLTPVQQRVLLSVDAKDAAARTSAGRKMLSAFERALGWEIEERPFWRPSLDPALLVSDLAVDAEEYAECRGRRPSGPWPTATATRIAIAVASSTGLASNSHRSASRFSRAGRR